MSNLISYIAALALLIALNTDCIAQYFLMHKGDKNPFDTAVAVRIDRYRDEGKKFDLSEQLVDSLEHELFIALQASSKKDTLIRTLTAEGRFLKQSSERKDQAFTDLNKVTSQIIEANDPKAILNRKELWLLVGFIAGIIATK